VAPPLNVEFENTAKFTDISVWEQCDEPTQVKCGTEQCTWVQSRVSTLAMIAEVVGYRSQLAKFVVRHVVF